MKKSMTPSVFGNAFPTAWDDFDRMLEGFFVPTTRSEFKFNPAVDIEELPNQYLVTLDIPGLNREDIKVEVKDNTLSISGERKREEKEEKPGYTRYERSHGTFERRFTLPETVSGKEVSAKYEDGVLKVTLPKSSESPSHFVDIN
ncbi:MAG: Hsp20/alpha crystallin family protein [Pseudobdellovibrionaceae bacterium]|nr:Hsp20/alpha crystallin family protein [Bdellovibrionales bacterium]USN47927.1 MAG: Hsp20/alpha crystallin family protein [Pseudobdellovibrionaceae bacterium]